mgnify:CR=1 FL=1
MSAEAGSGSGKTLVFLVGPPAVGKMTVGRELSRLTGLPLYHNHVSIEAVLPVFGFGDPAFNRLVTMQRREMIREVALSELPGLIFTFVWAFDAPGELEYVRKLVDPFEAEGGRVVYAALWAALDTRLARNESARRLQGPPDRGGVEVAIRLGGTVSSRSAPSRGQLVAHSDRGGAEDHRWAGASNARERGLSMESEGPARGRVEGGDGIEIRRIEPSDSPLFEDGAKFERYLSEDRAGRRTVFVALVDGAPAGFVTLLWTADDAVLRDSGLPEISDLWVREGRRNRGVGTALLDRAERAASLRSDGVGLNVGLHSGSGAAQRSYVRRGTTIWLHGKRSFSACAAACGTDILARS